MKWFYGSVMLAWVLVSYALIQRWPEARVLVPLTPVALTLPLVWIKAWDGQLFVIAALSVLISALSGFGQLAVIYFLFAAGLAWFIRSLPVPVSLRILVVVMAISLFETILGSVQTEFDAFFFAIFGMQTIAGFCVARILVDTKIPEYKT